jgi:putative ABC transport system permease protein
MFFVTYLRRELRRRMRQAVFIAAGLALGVGLVVTVTAASAGVARAESGVLGALYGVGTEVTVSGPASSAATPPPKSGGQPPDNGQTLDYPPSGPPQICTNGHCVNAAGHTFYRLFPVNQVLISASTVAAVARLHGVAAASGVLTLADQSITFPANFTGAPGGGSPQYSSATVDGVDTGQTSVGPLGAATVISGHHFTAADSDADVALVDSAYAASNDLKAGSTITIRQVRFTVIGIVSQPRGGYPLDAYIPLARAQALGAVGKDGGGSPANEVSLIYVAAASAADIPAVQSEISRLLPGDTVTAASSLASEVTGSLSSAAKLANDLGKWLSVLVLIAAFAVASLLTMAAVARRSGEFGTLKALGWRSRRVITQVLGESLAIGIAGAAAGIGLGFAGAAIIAAVAPTVSATDPSAVGSMQQTIAPAGSGAINPVANHAVSVPLSPSITIGVVVLAVILAMLGGLLAGAFGSWRIARLRPANALTRVA